MSQVFTPVEWAPGASIYEVNLRQYTAEGTFAAFQKELPRLKQMGVSIIWFMPITPISIKKRQGSLGSYYACSDYTAINPEFGDLDDFVTLVHTAHQLGLKVIIDWVANHTGWDHTWTTSHPEFYKKNAGGQFYDANGWIDVIDLDYSNLHMREALIRAMEYWLEKTDIDGFRCDMAHLVPLDFWRDARMRLDQRKKLFWLAETQDNTYHSVFDATYGWEILHAMEAYWNKKIGIDGIESVLRHYAEAPSDKAVRLFFTSNHDENSHSGSEYERLGDSALPFAVLGATWQNAMPLIYSGQELPNKARLAFFEKDPIKWDGQYRLHNFYQALLELHQGHPALQCGDPSIKTIRLQTQHRHVFAFVRRKGVYEVLVLLNLSGLSRQVVSLQTDAVIGSYRSIFSGLVHEFDTDNKFEMQAWEYFVYVKE